MVVPYLVSFQISLWTNGSPTTCAVSQLIHPPQPALLDHQPPPAHLPHQCMDLHGASFLAFVSPAVARRLLPSHGDKGKSCYQTLTIFSAAFRRLTVGQIHMTNICVTVRENWVLRGKTKGK